MTELRQSAGDSAVPAVSVIVTAYLVTPFITETLESVFAQTFTDYEVILVNDGSPDTAALEQVLQPYRGRLTYITQANRGASAARNTGVRAARAPLVAMLDGDDIWEPEYLARHVGTLQQDDTLDLVYPNALYFGDGAIAGHDCMSLSPAEGEVTFERVVSQTCNVIGFVTARRATMIAAGLYDESLRTSEDFELWARMLKCGARATYHREVLARYRRRAGSLSADTEAMHRSVVDIYDKIASMPELTPSERAAVLAQRGRSQADLRLTQGKKAFFRGDVDAAITGLTEANAVYNDLKITATLFLLRLAPRLLLRAYDLRDRLVYGTTTRV